MIDNVIEQIQNTLDKINFDYDGYICKYRQQDATKKRENGHKFNMRAHVKGLLYSQLSSQRPWDGIEKNLAKIDKIFMHYDPAKLKKASWKVLTRRIMDIDCGNRSIHKQMEHLACNIQMLECIKKHEKGGLDGYVASQSPSRIAKELSAGKYKLKQIGFALATEYMRNVGIDTVKPDTHICRLIAADRLGFVDSLKPKPEEAHARLSEMAQKSKHSAVYIDAILWLFAADGHGEICTAKPKCGKCYVSICPQNRLYLQPASAQTRA